MSNRRRPVRQVGWLPVPGPGEAWGVQVAVVSDRDDPQAVLQARQATHDLLIDSLGSLRRSGVRWTDYYAAEGRRVYAEIYAGADLSPEHRQLVDEVMRRLENPRSLLVVAWAIGEVPPGEVVP